MKNFKIFILQNICEKLYDKHGLEPYYRRRYTLEEEQQKEEYTHPSYDKIF